MTTVNKKKPIKTAVVVTYVIATLLLIAGWFVPAFGYEQGIKLADSMLFWYVPGILNAFLFPYLGKNLFIGTHIDKYSLPGFAEFESRVIPGVDIQIIALMLLLYLLITVLAIIFLIPVALGKKDKKTSLTCAYVIEGAALTALGILFIFSAWETNLSTTAKGFLNLICVFAAVLVILFVQSIIEKKSYGVVKMFLFAFSAAAFLFAMFAIDKMIAIICDTFKMSNVWEAILNAFNVDGGLYVANGTVVTGFNALKDMIGGMLSGNSSAIWDGDAAITANIVNVGVLALFAVLAFNLIVDFVGLMAGNKYNKNGVLLTHKGGKIFGVIRYAVALAIAIVIEVCTVVDKSMADGVCLYFVVVFILINLVIDIIRLARVPAQQRKADAQQADVNMHFVEEGMTARDDEQTEIISEGAVAAPAYATSAYAADATAAQPVEPAAEEQASEDEQLEIEELPEEGAEEENAPYVYTPRPVVYNGPTDAFLDTLTTEEKIEFCKVFLDKSKGNLPAKMPEYEIGGSNDDFFPAVFINLGRFRAMLTSSLLRKIYKYLNTK